MITTFDDIREAVLHLPKGDQMRLLALVALEVADAIPDDEVFRYASADQRAVITHNRQDFIHLHRLHPNHGGIIVCTVDTDFPALAARIHAQLQQMDSLQGQLLRINRGN